jgi:hypothetical protein
MQETWTQVPTWYGLHYEISNQGHIRSKDRVVTRRNGHTQRVPGQPMRTGVDDRGYLTVCLRRDGRQRQVRVHVLVLLAFKGPCPKGMEGLHRNDVKTDPRLDNLYYGTHTQNHADAARNGKAWWVKKRARDAAAGSAPPHAGTAPPA